MIDYLTPVQKCRPDTSNLQRVAFMQALDEIADPDVRNEILDTIEAVTALLMSKGKLKGYAASNQATEFVAACVWHKATAPR